MSGEAMETAQDRRRGTVVRIRGSVVDAQFPLGIPDIHNELRTGVDGHIVIEVINHLDAQTVRGIALTPTDGLARGSVPADDFTDPAAVHTFGHLSATIVLSRKRASEGLYPAIDPLRSRSKLLVPHVVGQRHYKLAQQIRKMLSDTLNKYETLFTNSTDL